MRGNEWRRENHHIMANKPLQYVLVGRKLNVGPQAGKTVQMAQPTGRHRVDFQSSCERVAKSTTFNRQEVQAVLSYATEIARDIVGNGDIVEFGEIGTLKPSFKSRAVPRGRNSRPTCTSRSRWCDSCPRRSTSRLTRELRTDDRQAQAKQEAGR